MHTIHLRDFHVPHGPNIFMLSVALASWSAIALFFFLLSWAFGGEPFKDTIGGNWSLGVLLAGMVVGAVSSMLTKPER